MKTARLAVLGVAIAAGGIAAYLASGSEQAPAPAPEPVAQIETVDILVAANDIGIGQAMAAQDFQWQAWPAASAGSAFLRKSDRPDAIAQLTGAVARAPLARGEPIRENNLIKANGSGYMAAILPQGMRATSTEISPETGAGGFILPNDRVDVILVRRVRDPERQQQGASADVVVPETILTDVRVLAIDQTVEEKNGQRVVVGKTATLELSPRQAELLAAARQAGTLHLALRSLADADPAKRPPEEDLRDRIIPRINVVRFGVSTPVLPR